MEQGPRDLVVRLEPLGATPWDGRDDANVDFERVLASGRRLSSTAITPQNILTLWRTSYPEKNAMAMPAMLVVRTPPLVDSGGADEMVVIQRNHQIGWNGRWGVE